MAEMYAGCGTDGCDHTPGRRRAWCSTCSEWCYPDVACVRGQLSRSQAAYEVRLGELARLRHQIAAVRELHAPHPTSTPSQFDAWCDTCSTSAPCRTLQALDDTEDRPMTAPTLPATVDRSAMVQAVRDLLGIDLTYVRSVQLDRDTIGVEYYDVDPDGRAMRDATGEDLITYQVTIPVTS